MAWAKSVWLIEQRLTNYFNWILKKTWIRGSVCDTVFQLGLFISPSLFMNRRQDNKGISMGHEIVLLLWWVRTQGRYNLAKLCPWREIPQTLWPNSLQDTIISFWSNHSTRGVILRGLIFYTTKQTGNSKNIAKGIIIARKLSLNPICKER